MITKKQEIEKAYSEGLQTGYRLGLKGEGRTDTEKLQAVKDMISKILEETQA